MNLLPRFEDKFMPEPNTGCWIWTGCISALGYGRFRIKGRTEQAHRVSYEMLVGPIPDGLTIDHLCRNRSCVNPDHMEPVSLRENILRSDSPGGANSRKTHCPHGHALDGVTHVAGRRRRYCRTCMALAAKRRKEANLVV